MKEYKVSERQKIGRKLNSLIKINESKLSNMTDNDIYHVMVETTWGQIHGKTVTVIGMPLRNSLMTEFK